MCCGGVSKIEQLNIVGKRSGEGFVAHKAQLADGLSRVLAERITLLDTSVGRKGFLNLVKSLHGSNTVKVIPNKADGMTASFKVICGANISIVPDGQWVSDNTPLTFSEVKVSPLNIVTPNIGAAELANAIAKVLPFTATDDKRPVLQCVDFVIKDNKLTLVSADGYRLATISLPFDGADGEVLVVGGDLKGIASALRKANRASLTITETGENDSKKLTIETELVNYRFTGADGKFPDWEKLIPSESTCQVEVDAMAILSELKALAVMADAKDFGIDLDIGDGKIGLAVTDSKGVTELPAITTGSQKIRLDGGYLASVVRACGNAITDIAFSNANSPALFSTDGYRVVLMPMLTTESRKQAEAEPKRKGKGKRKAKAEAEPVVEPEAEPAIA